MTFFSFQGQCIMSIFAQPHCSSNLSFLGADALLITELLFSLVSVSLLNRNTLVYYLSIVTSHVLLHVCLIYLVYLKCKNFTPENVLLAAMEQK